MRFRKIIIKEGELATASEKSWKPDELQHKYHQHKYTSRLICTEITDHDNSSV